MRRRESLSLGDARVSTQSFVGVRRLSRAPVLGEQYEKSKAIGRHTRAVGVHYGKDSFRHAFPTVRGGLLRLGGILWQ